jgi:ABC-2 type transport system ATP-binding protein
MISINTVTKTFKNLTAVNGLSLTIEEGQSVALLGPNGAGKTTLVEMIEGIQTPDSGTITIFGKNWKDHEKDLRHLIGISLQETKLIDRITVMETLELFAKFYSVPKSRCQEVLEQIGLSEKANAEVTKMSGGQKQKVALGLAILHKPKILILDEPTTGLDPNSRRDLWSLLYTLQKENVSLILTTHYMEEAQVLCDRIVMMNKGQIIADGSFEELASKHGDYELITFKIKGLFPELPFESLPGFIGLHWDQASSYGEMKVKTIAETLPAFLNLAQQSGVTLYDLECRRLTLDDLFITLTGRRLGE